MKKLFLFFLIFKFLIISNIILAQNCNYVMLVKCFIDVLDDWTLTLYELKDNVVTINKQQCEHLKKLDNCIKDTGSELHECNHNEIVTASNTVSDLLTHRKNSGSFLKSYYLLTYACSPEGQNLLDEHRNCLARERIGEMTLSAGTYLSEKFLEHPDEEVCSEVNNKLQEYMDAMSGLCEEEASLIMCKSLTNMFIGLHPEKLNNCEFNCFRVKSTDSSQSNHHVKNFDYSRSNLDDSNQYYVNNSIMQSHAARIDGQNLNNASQVIFNANLILSIILFIETALFLVR